MITKIDAEKIFTYDSTHPLALRWAAPHKNAARAVVGEIAGYWHSVRAKSDLRHRFVNIPGQKRVPVSRVVWIIHHGRQSRVRLWFKDGNAGDCRIENLTEEKPPSSREKTSKTRREYFADWKNAKTPQEWKEFIRRRNLARDYGITVEQYEAFLDAQRNMCAICLRPETMMRRGAVPPLSVDHCHTTKKVRGLLCASCNNGIGRFRDDPDLLRKAAEYLEEHAHSSP